MRLYRILSLVLSSIVTVAVLPMTAHAASDGYPWVSQNSAEDATWKSVTYGNGLFVAVGSTGSHVMTSPDGVSWTSRAAAANNYWQAVTFGGNLFVAVASSGSGDRVMTSPDGITWTTRSSASDSQWMAVAYGNSTFVATAAGGEVMTSPDGITWTSRTASPTRYWSELAFGNGVFVAASPSGATQGVMTSPDGITWTLRSTAENAGWGALTFGNGKFVLMALDSGGYILNSADGISWTRVASDGNAWSSVVYGNGVFVAVASSGSAQVITSTTGSSGWTQRTAASTNQWTSVTYAEGMFVAVSQTGSGDRVMTSGSFTPQTVSWAPSNTAVLTTESPLTPSSAATRTPSDGGTISYAVTNAGSTGCAVNSSTGVLSFASAGTCEVTATAAAVPEAYAEGSSAVTFTISDPPVSAPPSGGSSSSSSASSEGAPSGGGLNEISRIVPAASGAPGSVVALAGWGLSTTRSVVFNDSPAVFRVVNDGHVEVTVPDVPAGVYVIHAQLAADVGRASYWDGFTVLDRAATSGSEVSTGPEAPVKEDSAREWIVDGPDEDRLLARGLVVLGESRAGSVPTKVVKRPVASKLRVAPRVSLRRDMGRQFLVRGLTENSVVSAQIRVGKKYFSLGRATTSGDGRLALPALAGGQRGKFPIRLKVSNGETRFLLLTML